MDGYITITVQIKPFYPAVEPFLLCNNQHGRVRRQLTSKMAQPPSSAFFRCTVCMKLRRECLSVGTAQSVGCTVDNKHPHDVIEEITNGEIEVPEVNIDLA